MTKVMAEQDAILLASEYRYVDRCRSIPGGRWDARRRVWRYPKTPMIAATILRKFADVRVDVDQEVRRLAESVRLEEANSFKKAEDLPPIPQTATQPWRHQLQAYHFAMNLPAAALFLEMGTGKSKVAVDVAVNKGCKTILIVCPKSVLGVWPKQFALHAGVNVETVVPKGSTAAKKAQVALEAVERCERIGRPVAVIVNYETVWREGFAEFVLSREWDMVILDESHKIKAPGGKASMFCYKLGQKARNKLILTGTPAPHSPLDVYAQYRFLDPGIFGTSFNAFKTRYAVMGGYEGREIIAYRMMRTLPNGRPNPYYDPKLAREWEEKLHSVSFRVRSADVLQLPEAIHETRTFELSPKASRIYRQLEDEFYAQVDAGEITVSNALTKLLRLQQITSGFVRNDDGQDVEIDTGKAELLADVLDDIDPSEPVVVFCRFQHDLDVVRKVVEARPKGNRYGELSGRRNDLAKDSTFPENVDVLGVQIQAGGAGIDLTRARYAIYYSLGFSLGDYEQSLARVHRPGQTRTTYYYHLLAEGTVDEKVYRALRARKNVVEEVMFKRA